MAEHPYATFQRLVSRDARFELRPSPGKGWGIFTTSSIEQGVAVLKESPLFVINKPHPLITEYDVRAAFQNLGPRGKEQFSCLRYNSFAPFTSMEEAFAENTFALSINQSPAHGLFILASRFNHSCIPNCNAPTLDRPIVEIYTLRNIVAGEELTICYETDFPSRERADRHRCLRFSCNCRACILGTKFQQLSDMRRIFIRGLQYLTLGEDIDGRKLNDSVQSFAFHASIKAAAENFTISLCQRWIYLILTIVLLEEEGLLDQFMTDRMVPGVMSLANKFKSPENIKVVKLALEQETWLGKFCVAGWLWGRRDANDQNISSSLRMMKGLKGTGF